MRKALQWRAISTGVVKEGKGGHKRRSERP
jgi:hypothetical protein